MRTTRIHRADAMIETMNEGECRAAYEQQMRLAFQWGKPGAREIADAIYERLDSFAMVRELDRLTSPA